MTTSNSALPNAPKEYSQEYMNRLLRQLNLILTRINSIHPITVGSDLSQQVVGYPISGLTIVNVPTSSANLPLGSVWSDGGTLKIVS
jgi:hypothetical protein